MLMVTLRPPPRRVAKDLPVMRLCLAATGGKLPEVKRLIEEEAVNVNALNHEGRTALICAAWEGRLSVVKYLLGKGADVNLVSDPKRGGESPLHAAVLSGKLDVVKLIVEAGADLDYQPKDNPGATALAQAKASRLKKIVAYLLEMYESRGTPKPTTIPTGVTTFETNDAAFVVEASVEQVAGAISQRIEAKAWTRDALGKMVKITARCYAIFKLTGQPWSVVMKLGCPVFKHFPSLPDAQALSQSLQARALFVANSDTAGVTQYALFDRGNLIEFFDYGSVDKATSKTIAAPIKKIYHLDLMPLRNLTFHKGKTFGSTLRDVHLARVKNDMDFVNEYVKIQNAFIPFYPDAIGQTGKTVELSLEGLGEDDIERLDYIAAG